MLIPSIIASSVILVAALVALTLYKLPDKASYEVKTKPSKFHLISSTLAAFVSLGSFVATAILYFVDYYEAAQFYLFFFGCSIGLYGIILLFSLPGFVAIKGDQIYIRLLFRRKKAKISDIKTIRRGTIDFAFIFKDGFRAEFFGVDPILDKVIARKDPETNLNDVIEDPRFFWNRPKSMKMTKITSIITVAVCAVIMVASCFLSPFDKPIAKENATLVTGEIEAIRKTDGPDYYFYIKGNPVEYQIPKEIGNYLDKTIFDDLAIGDTVSIYAENFNNRTAIRQGYVKADHICVLEYDSKQYLTYNGYCEGTLKKRIRGLCYFTTGLTSFGPSALWLSQVLFFEKYRKDAESKKNK